MSKGFQLIYPNIQTKLDLDPDKVLFNNIGEFEDVLIIGTSKETGHLVHCASYTDAYRMVAEHEWAKQYMLKFIYQDQEL